MRVSSTTETVTCQPPPSSRSRPRTDSIGRPMSSGSSSRTRATTSRPDSRWLELLPLELPLLRAKVFLLSRCRAAGQADLQALDQLLLALGALLVVDGSVVVRELEFEQLAAKALLVIELALRLF